MERKIIQNLTDYHNWLALVNKDFFGTKTNFSWQRSLFFRGHASLDWTLLPSVCRNKKLKSHEHDALSIAEKTTWSCLKDFNTYIEKLVFFQHHGLATRLLDVTKNPLIALYFACQPAGKKENPDGQILAGDSDLLSARIVNGYPVEDIAEILFRSKTNNYIDYIDTKYKGQDLTRFCSAIFFDAPFNSERIRAQQGAFIMPQLLSKNSNDKYEMADNDDIRNGLIQLFNIEQTAIVPEKEKEGLLKELDRCGINLSTVFCDISSQLKYINETMKNRLVSIDCAEKTIIDG